MATTVFIIGSLALHGWPAIGGLGRASLHRHSITPACCDLGVSTSILVALEDDSSEMVTLSGAGDAATVAADLAERHGLSKEQLDDLEEQLSAQWDEAVSQAPPIYVGPMCEDNTLRNQEASVDLESVGLVLEVADSAVADGGRGLFIRCLADTDSVTLEEGTAVCGYAEGEMTAAPDSDGGKSVAFALASAESVVWFEKELRTVAELLDDESIDSIAGHVAVRDAETGALEGIGLDPAFGPRYFVPSAEQPATLRIGAFGQMANDLAINGLGVPETAGGAAAADPEECQALYESASSASNVLVLVFRLERGGEDSRVLIPTRPISTLSKSITFINDVPMELGCRYGGRYWSNRAAASSLKACYELQLGGRDADDAPTRES
jgi:hypothetical protein